jgi:hypothetical protein
MAEFRDERIFPYQQGDEVDYRIHLDSHQWAHNLFQWSGKGHTEKEF